MPAGWVAPVMEQLVHRRCFLFLGQGKGHWQQPLPKIVPTLPAAGFACYDGSEFLTPGAYLESSGEGRKQVRYPILQGDVVPCRSFMRPCAHVCSQAGHLCLLSVTGLRCWHFEGLLLGCEMSCVLEDPPHLQGLWDLYKATVLEMAECNQAETHLQCLTETSFDFIVLEMLNFSSSCIFFFLSNIYSGMEILFILEVLECKDNQEHQSVFILKFI